MIPLTLLVAAAAPAPPHRPTLLVMVTVDQLRPDYFARWSGQWRGGFRRLLRDGAVFPNALQDHAVTETAPGHATILSGRHPARTGIVLNEFGVPDSSTRLLGAPNGMGASPRRFIGTTLIDWLRHADPAMQFLSVSRKDRGAILPIGRSRGPVFWYVGGRFTTSSYYADTLPTWVTGWNARGGVAALAGRRWQLLLPDSAYAEPDDEPYESGGKNRTFPHRLPTEPRALASAVLDTPWQDSLTLDLALDGARVLRLGQRSHPDVLAISLSATDYIGHTWGPDSREMHDHLLHLDRYLGWFLDSLAVLVPEQRIVLALTADHGVVSFPERTIAAGGSGGRIPLGGLIRQLNRQLLGPDARHPVLFESSGLVFTDSMLLRQRGLSRDSLSTLVEARLRALPGVVAVWSPRTLALAPAADVAASRWRHTLPSGFPWLACASPAPGYIWSDEPGSTTHGTTNADDVGVPIVLLGSMIRPGIRPDTVRTIDLAPTLAQIFGVRPSEPLDGRTIAGLGPRRAVVTH
ncbi:MAG: alkaline phosphatase family protein [Gemmatimonadales bacterium]